MIQDHEAAKRIGQIYLTVHPEEGRLDRLTADFLGADRPNDLRGLRQKVTELRVRDFGNEDTTIVNGWLLARVEARLCSLLCLL